jgi:hypothetical protein
MRKINISSINYSILGTTAMNLNSYSVALGSFWHGFDHERERISRVNFENVYWQTILLELKQV